MTGPDDLAVLTELHERFSDWTIGRGPGGSWLADQRSSDGRSRRTVAGATPAELLARLDTAEAGQ